LRTIINMLSTFTGAFHTRWETERFPEAECTHQSERESDVFDGKQAYLCLVVDSRWSDHATLAILRPYTCKDLEDGSTLFGWSDGPGNYYDHWEKSVHEDNNRVVAWTPVEEGFNLHRGTPAEALPAWVRP
jgi:hypothetical protein